MSVEDAKGTSIVVDDRRIVVRTGESVLDACERSGVEIQSSCRAGLCHLCRVRAIAGVPPPESQIGLDHADAAEGWFLACRARPSGALSVTLDGAAGARARVRLVERVWLAKSVIRARFEWLDTFPHRAGQFVELVRSDGLSRSYSIAGVPALDPYLDLHVRIFEKGAMSAWLAHEAEITTELEVRGPGGKCVYAPASLDQPLLLAATGTGLAPLIGVAREALAAGHRGRIVLFHGGLDENALYLQDVLRNLAATHAHFIYQPGVLRGPAAAGVEIGPLAEVIDRRFPDLEGWRVHLCGAPELVELLRRQCYLSGAALRDIVADPFVARVQPTMR
ncbi:MAG: 2Fe-2S iron-sulfur cluster binding domain-containing protein [Planctomycetota bacterium]|nr:2Fe-2S iron-sulfur cluster binding domain-containing protein [Planctomycetota bacterium]